MALILYFAALASALYWGGALKSSKPRFARSIGMSNWDMHYACKANNMES